MKKIFEIEWPDEYGDKWLDHNNVLSLLTSNTSVSEKHSLSVRDVTGDTKELNPVARRTYVLGGHDF